MLLYKFLLKIIDFINCFCSYSLTYLYFKFNLIEFSSIRTNGIPYITISRGGEMSIGQNFKMNNGIKGNPIGCYSKCTFFVAKGKKINIGCNVGISQTALIAIDNITIGDNVKMGGGVKIYTSDFHSLNPVIRMSDQDMENRKSAPVIIHNNVFIGAYSIILKGVEIGDNSIIGAGSVVTKSVPENEIWAGNPAKFIRKISI